MSDAVIRAEELSKKYLIGHHRQERYSALRDVALRAAKNWTRATLDAVRGRQLIVGDEVEEFWALRDVSFELRHGDVVGIVGRNGAGKSTLLKILSRITEPSMGRVEITGRVASLLEVGTGFHLELTGRENIYLNGAILGMKHAEIRRKFDEIVAFSEVEKFIDTPVKRYSSGMYVRLAFAVAAHLEPEILVVDEVLAVGDAEFQQKCLGKMKHVAGQGRTVLFVSHNLAAVRSLCNRALLLAGGKVIGDGSVEAVARQYINSSSSSDAITFATNPTRPSIVSIIVDRDALARGDLIVDIAFVSPRPLPAAVGGVMLRADSGEPLWGSDSRFHSSGEIAKGLTSGTLRCEARRLPIRPGRYHLSAWLADWHEELDSKQDVLSLGFGLADADPLRPSVSAVGYLDWPGTWRSVKIEDASAA
ncbi:MAG: ABC transporter ATP-binding protein [Hyphomicrobium sp.]|uniref:ABC transporter ATP-binding protein n=1 Tax=Hyphomicrobium sp. TaxID=82 RepID=UPI0039E5B55B